MSIRTCKCSRKSFQVLPRCINRVERVREYDNTVVRSRRAHGLNVAVVPSTENDLVEMFVEQLFCAFEMSKDDHQAGKGKRLRQNGEAVAETI
ncbi:hypothetical protein N7505_001353 [Penicillium chrysogenum]|uniref:Uncharacterized protein n=1 Tax=Penicillium chrysogenum TaxID=5076 RepID=A0ABQ8WWM6_PENCH|nr:hypothetical protein N7505_001353 [Penicillium chrysogenum]